MRILARAELHPERNGIFGLVRATGVDALDEVGLQVRRLAKTTIHVRLGTVERRVLGDNALKAIDLRWWDG